MRALRERRVGLRVAAIFAGHERLPIKRLSYDEVICGHIKCIDLPNDSSRTSLRDPKLRHLISMQEKMVRFHHDEAFTFRWTPRNADSTSKLPKTQLSY